MIYVFVLRFYVLKNVNYYTFNDLKPISPAQMYTSTLPAFASHVL
jgi:hypothetical protein